MREMSAAKEGIYLDNASTTKPLPEVVEAVLQVLETAFGNPSSLHGLGLEAERLIDEARQSVADLMGARQNEIYFTSGGTEANNWAILGSMGPSDRTSHIVSTQVEHPSVLSLLDHLRGRGHGVTLVPPDSDGLVDVDEVMEAVTPDTSLVSVMLVQNEIGAIEPCEEIGRRLGALGRLKPRFHVDAVQGFAKLPIDVSGWRVDLLTASAHKIHGPKGIGALYVRRGLRLDPFVFGGGQEHGLRSGTENVPGIVGFGAACRVWARERQEIAERLEFLRRRLIDGVKALVPDAVLHGPGTGPVAPHIVNFSFPRLRGETVLHALEGKGVYVSTGSACSSRKTAASPVIRALGGKDDEALSSVRFSLSMLNTRKEVDEAIHKLAEVIGELSAWKTGDTRNPPDGRKQWRN